MSWVSSTRTAPTFSRCWTRSCRVFSTFPLRNNTSADKLITRPVHRQNESRLLRLGFNLLPEANDVCVHRTCSGKAIVSPNILEQPVPAQRLSRMNEEVLQEFELLRREIQRMALARYLATPQIHFDLAERILLVGLGSDSCAAQYGLHPREQLTNGKRLGHVIVGAQFKSNHFVHFLPAGSKH